MSGQGESYAAALPPSFVDSIEPEIAGKQHRLPSSLVLYLRSTVLLLTWSTMKKAARRRLLFHGRGDWRSFEPCPQDVAAYLQPFAWPGEPFLATVERLVRLCA